MKTRIFAVLVLGLTMLFGLVGCGGHDKVERTDSFASNLYAAKNPYIENTSANNDLVRRLGINSIGKYTLNVINSDHPFTLEVRFMYLNSNVDQSTLEERMTYNGVVLMSLIGDCEQVNWTYSGADGLVQGTIGVDYANEMLGTDIKKAGKDEASFIALCERLFPDKASGSGDEEATQE